MDNLYKIEQCDRKYNPVEEAYKLLVKAVEEGDETDIAIAVYDAIGYLGEALDD